MNAWAAQAANELERGTASVEALRERVAALSEFSSGAFPAMTRGLPVLYMFSGTDLITAQALFPEAPDYHLVADFPVGHPSCFVDAACTSQANESATAFFRHWANLRYARQSTNLMRRAFERVGQLPALLVSLHLMRQPVLHATTRNVAPPSISASMRTKVSAKNLIAGRIRAGAAAGGASGRRLETTIVASGGTPGVVIPSITLHTERCRVAYHSLLLKSGARLSHTAHPSYSRPARFRAERIPRVLRVLQVGPFRARPALEAGLASLQALGARRRIRRRAARCALRRPQWPASRRRAPPWLCSGVALPQTEGRHGHPERSASSDGDVDPRPHDGTACDGTSAVLRQPHADIPLPSLLPCARFRCPCSKRHRIGSSAMSGWRAGCCGTRQLRCTMRVAFAPCSSQRLSHMPAALTSQCSVPPLCTERVVGTTTRAPDWSAPIGRPSHVASSPTLRTEKSSGTQARRLSSRPSSAAPSYPFR